MRLPVRIVSTFAAAGLAFGVSTASNAASLAECTAQLKAWVIANGVDAKVAEIALGKVVPDEDPVKFSKAQPEFKTPIWDYIAFLVDDQRIADGKRMLRQYDRVLRQVEAKYGPIRSTFRKLPISRSPVNLVFRRLVHSRSRSDRRPPSPPRMRRTRSPK